MKSPVARMVLVLFTLVLGAPATVKAQSADGQAAIWVWARSVHNDGSPGSSAGNDDRFVVGNRATNYLWVGAGDSWCAMGASSGTATTLETLVKERTHVWRVTTMPLKHDKGTFIFDLEWARYSDGNAARPVESGRHQLALAEGQTHLLELLRGPSADRCSVASVVLEARVEIREDSALADRLIQYDLWLVHSDPNGRRQTRHIVLTGQHGAEVPLVFGALRRQVPTIAADQFAFDVTTRVSGNLRGRLRADGLIDLEIDLSRGDRLERREGLRDAARGGYGMGRKLLQLTPGRAIELELPAPSGAHGVLASAAGADAVRRSVAAMRAARPGDPWPQTPTEPLSIVDGRLVVSFKPYFEGHRLSVVMRAKPVA